MKEKLMRALLVALGAGIGITLVSFINGEGFSITEFILYAVVAFIVDMFFMLFLGKNKNKRGK
ncbi:hypothetical protein [Anaerosporobacter sp.]